MVKMKPPEHGLFRRHCGVQIGAMKPMQLSWCDPRLDWINIWTKAVAGNARRSFNKENESGWNNAFLRKQLMDISRSAAHYSGCSRLASDIGNCFVECFHSGLLRVWRLIHNTHLIVCYKMSQCYLL